VGKTVSDANTMHAAFGPPPRVWGKPTPCQPPSLPARGPPPRVWGKRYCDKLERSRISVHPHACGENSAWARPGLQTFRSTPTRVGKTPVIGSQRQAQRGPPPRVWGKLLGVVRSGGRNTVHPHACGENPYLTLFLRPRNTTSPVRVSLPVANPLPRSPTGESCHVSSS
jgi:hypothetical protein